MIDRFQTIYLFLGMRVILFFVCLVSINSVFGQIQTDSLVLKKPDVETNTIRICAPSRAGVIPKPPLYVIKYGKKEYQNNKEYFIPDISELFSPNDIASINVLKDSASAEKYGEDGKNGVIVITLKDNKVSTFKKKSKEV